MGELLLACQHPVSAIIQIDGEPRCGACASDSTKADPDFCPSADGSGDVHSVSGSAAEEEPAEESAAAEEQAEDEEAEESEPEAEPATPGVEEGTIEVGAVEVEPGAVKTEICDVAAHEERQDMATMGEESGQATLDAPSEASGSPPPDSTLSAENGAGAARPGPVRTEPLDSLPQPVHSVRADRPGARGCWAMSKTTGEPCGAARRHGEDYCNAHSGVGVARDPQAYVPKAHAALQRNRAIRAQMRLQLGNTRPTGPRAALKAMAIAESKRLAGRALNGALSPDVPDAKAAALALAIIREADPPAQTTLELSANLSPEEIGKLSWSESLALARQLGIEVPAELPPAATQA